jgi:hypothetical protein
LWPKTEAIQAGDHIVSFLFSRRHTFYDLEHLRNILWHFFFFFPLVLQPQFGPWPTSMKLSVSLRFTRSWAVGRTSWAGDQLATRPLPAHKHRKTHIHTQTLNIHALSGIQTYDPGFRVSEDSACLRHLLTL